MATLQLQEQIALVTGASSGVGASVAIALAAAGAKVAVNYVEHAEGAEAVVAEIVAAGGEAIAIQADISQEDQVLSMFQQVFEVYETLDILVNNAGRQQNSAFVDMTLEQWCGVIDMNLTGHFLCSREATKEFIRRGVVPEKSCSAGKIICMSLLNEVIYPDGDCNYAVSKGGIMSLVKSMAKELAPYKIRVNSIGPDTLKPTGARSSEAKAGRLMPILTSRVGVPKDLGRMMVWLASDQSAYVNGTTLFLDGGMTLYPGFTQDE